MTSWSAPSANQRCRQIGGSVVDYSSCHSEELYQVDVGEQELKKFNKKEDRKQVCREDLVTVGSMVEGCSGGWVRAHDMFHLRGLRGCSS